MVPEQAPVASFQVPEQICRVMELGADVVTDCEIPKELTVKLPVLLTEKKD